MRKYLAVKLFFLVLIMSICFLSIPNHSVAQKVIKLNYSNFFPAPHKNSILTEQWCKEVEKRTNGRVKVTYFPGGTLTPAAQTYDGVVKGIADIGYSVFAYTRGKFPMMAAIDLPLGYKSGTQATALINAYYKKFNPKELDEVQVMYLHGNGPFLFHTKKPVYKLEDLKGMKIRAMGTTVPIVQALGGTPVGATMPETYDAIRTGVVEGTMNPYEALQGFKLGEVVAATTESYPCANSAAMFIVMNKAKWNSLPPDIQKIIAQINEEWSVKQGKVWDEIDKEGKDFVVKKGNKIITLSKEEGARWAAAVNPGLDQYAKDLNAKGLPGDEALKFCLDFLKSH
jgi:TRAP-type transport system periplasmic protein